MGFNPASVTTFDQIEPREREWLWPGFILAADVSSWVAEGGTGKGSASVSVAARMTLGHPMPPEDASDPYTEPETWAPPGYVIVAALEDDPDIDTVNRLRANGADMRYVIELSKVEIASATGVIADDFQLPRDVGYLGQVIRHFSNPENDDPDGVRVLPGGVRMVIIDPFMAAAGVPVSGNQQVRAVLKPLRNLAKDTGAGILIITHFHKGAKSRNARSGSMTDYVAGSAGFTQDIRCNIVMIRDDANPEIVHMLTLKSNVGNAEPVAFIVKVDGVNTRVLWGQPRHRGADLRLRLGRRIMHVLTSREAAGERAVNAVELAAILDASHREVMRALAMLAREGRASQGRLGWAPAPALTPGES